MQLREEHQQLSEAILTLERLVYRKGRRRGRPPKWLSAANVPVEEKPAKRRKHRLSAEGRAAIAAAAKKRWAERRKQAAKEAKY
ncbi:MAG: hypothetical protein ACRD44_07105 [Bryobacteraceae bacterium]